MILSYGVWDLFGLLVLVLMFFILIIFDVNKLYMSKYCLVIIYLFVLVGGGVDFINVRIFIRMYGEIK